MDLFPDAPRHRKPPRKLMALVDCGSSDDFGAVWCKMECRHCDHKTGWFQTDATVTEIKRGLPCPKCNEGIEE